MYALAVLSHEAPLSWARDRISNGTSRTKDRIARRAERSGVTRVALMTEAEAAAVRLVASGTADPWAPLTVANSGK
jgi:hypothetical protein